jgi:uncharacterized cupredoxin-like copper-binding protein
MNTKRPTMWPRRHFTFIALSPLLMSAEAVFSHGNQPHPGTTPAAAPPEQKPWGIAGVASKVRRTVSLVLDDQMRITPNHLTVPLGQTWRLRAVNKGGLLHEVVLGTEEELTAHAELMKRFPDMAHDEPYMAHVDPGKQADIIWHFNRPGRFGYACLLPGHFEAGMRGTLIVQ